MGTEPDARVLMGARMRRDLSCLMVHIVGALARERGLASTYSYCTSYCTVL